MTGAEAKVALIRALTTRGTAASSGSSCSPRTWSGPRPTRAGRHGRDELLAFLQSFMGAWDEYSNELEDDPGAAGRPRAGLLDEWARGRSSGVEMSWSVAAIVEIEDGLITRYTGMDRDEALRRLGLAE